MLARRISWLTAGLAVAVALILLGRRAAGYIPAFAAWIDSQGALGALAFMAGYVVATVALVPGSLMTLAAGALFGLVRGTLLVLTAASVGATAAFLVSRYVARAVVLKRMAGEPRFHALDAAIEREGRKIVFLIRLSPVFPFNVTNYALGLTSVRLSDYVIACAGMLPGTLLWVYYGHLIGDVARAVSGARIEHGIAYWAVLAVGLIATLLVTIVITRAAKRALRSSVDLPAE